jgi:glucan 1,3-beta-glucosidase
VTDDSDAINAAIRDGNRCGPWVCDSSTTTPAIIYFPAGTYLIGKSLDLYYLTHVYGNPNSRPILKAAPTLEALALIDASRYSDQNGAPGWTSTNLFMRQIKNLVIDLTARAPEKGAQGIHWPASQATSIQNVKIVMTKSRSSVHAGIFIENGKLFHALFFCGVKRPGFKFIEAALWYPTCGTFANQGPSTLCAIPDALSLICGTIR